MDLSRKEDREPIIQRMAELRERYDKTQQQCADALGVAQNTYAGMESGAQRIRRRDLVTLADLYELTLEEAFPAFAAQEATAAA